jgi:hypothetical protein
MTKRCLESPAPIDANENVARGLYSPGIFEDGKVTIAAVKMDELLPKLGHVDQCGDSSGVSVFRVDQINGEVQAKTELQAIVNRPSKNGIPRVAVGFAVLSVSAVTQIGDGPLLLLDDGKTGLTSHAVIRAPDGKEKAALRRARDNLVSLMNKSLHTFPAAVAAS